MSSCCQYGVRIDVQIQFLSMSVNSAGPFVISLFLFVKIDLATDSGSEYDRDEKKIGFHFFLHV